MHWKCTYKTKIHNNPPPRQPTATQKRWNASLYTQRQDWGSHFVFWVASGVWNSHFICLAHAWTVYLQQQITQQSTTLTTNCHQEVLKWFCISIGMRWGVSFCYWAWSCHVEHRIDTFGPSTTACADKRKLHYIEPHSLQSTHKMHSCHSFYL